MATLIEEIRSLRTLRQYEKARDLSMQLLKSDERNADAWWNLALAQGSLFDFEGALESLKSVLKLSPKFAAGWAQYGVYLAANGQPSQGLKALSQALQNDPSHEFAARQAARICHEQKDTAGQIHYLNRLDAMGKANGDDFNALGIAHWEKKHFSTAIEYYHRSASISKGSAPYFNLALVYNHNEVSQDVDAVDSLERVLKIDPSHKRAKEQIDRIKPRLQSLASVVLSLGESGLQKDEWYRFYINPFELLVGTNKDYQLEAFDTKTIQRLKNQLLQEIELEDGFVHYLDGLRLDKSKAIGVFEELNNETIKRYHWMVFREPHLLSFLSRGDIRHFLCTQDYKPLDLLDEIDSEWSGFKEWLSPFFAKQYDLVLTRAIKHRRSNLIESLFDGRRWVLKDHDELCFEGARRQIDALLEPLRRAEDGAKKVAPTMANLEAILAGDRIVTIVNLLPEPFREQQNEAVSFLRGMSIKAFNEHEDTELARSILALSRKFNFKSTTLKQRLEEDFKQIEKLIAEERKHEAKLTSGNDSWQVTKDGVKKGTVFIPAKDVTSVRWGILIELEQYVHTYRFLVAFRDDRGNLVDFSWRNSDNIEKHRNHFNDLVKAALNYIVPNICEQITNRLREAKPVTIGQCALTQGHIRFEKSGWFSSKQIIIPWKNVETKIQNGNMIVYDTTSPKNLVEMELRTTENAVILPFFQKVLAK
jgi:tetratricopeptide (TPR) repeat protein